MKIRGSFLFFQYFFYFHTVFPFFQKFLFAGVKITWEKMLEYFMMPSKQKTTTKTSFLHKNAITSVDCFLSW